MKICKSKKEIRSVVNPMGKTIRYGSAVFLTVFLLGCQTEPLSVAVVVPSCSGFSIASVELIGLTQLIGTPEGSNSQTIRVFAELRDAYDSKLKAPATFRFSLCSYMPHQSDPKGIQLQTWPDFRLTEPHTNHLYWRDYLRAYEFVLEVQPPISPEGTFLLEVTCLTPEPKRIQSFYVLQAK